MSLFVLHQKFGKAVAAKDIATICTLCYRLDDAATKHIVATYIEQLLELNRSSNWPFRNKRPYHKFYAIIEIAIRMVVTDTSESIDFDIMTNVLRGIRLSYTFKTMVKTNDWICKDICIYIMKAMNQTTSMEHLRECAMLFAKSSLVYIHHSPHACKNVVDWLIKLHDLLNHDSHVTKLLLSRIVDVLEAIKGDPGSDALREQILYFIANDVKPELDFGLKIMVYFPSLVPYLPNALNTCMTSFRDWMLGRIPGEEGSFHCFLVGLNKLFNTCDEPCEWFSTVVKVLYELEASEVCITTIAMHIYKTLLRDESTVAWCTDEVAATMTLKELHAFIMADVNMHYKMSFLNPNDMFTKALLTAIA